MRPEIKAQWSSASISYEGFAEFEFKDVKQFFAEVADPYYALVVAKDEDTFLDKSATATYTTNAASTLRLVKPVVVKGKSILKD